MAKNEDDAIRTIDLDVLKSIGSKNNVTKSKLGSVLRAWSQGRISGKNALGMLLRKKKKGGAVNKYSHGGSVRTDNGHALTYKR
jgi:hypothetical protein